MEIHPGIFLQAQLSQTFQNTLSPQHRLQHLHLHQLKAQVNLVLILIFELGVDFGMKQKRGSWVDTKLQSVRSYKLRIFLSRNWIHDCRTFSGGWPWLAALGYRDSKSGKINFLCGGALISKSHVSKNCADLLNLFQTQTFSLIEAHGPGYFCRSSQLPTASTIEMTLWRSDWATMISFPIQTELCPWTLKWRPSHSIPNTTQRLSKMILQSSSSGSQWLNLQVWIECNML